MDWGLLFSLLLVWAFVGAAGASLAIAVWSLRWPSVKGTIEVSLVETTVDSRARLSETHELAYSYTVRGANFLGSNVKPWGGGSGTVVDSDSEKPLWSAARDNARWYRPGVVVDIYYCPMRPQWSCLEPGGFVLPLAFGGLGLVFYLALVR
ncbi:MAG TPA: DUF3592 domain-containing protein [Lacunisphaera sp.]|nr:DUF3592 domain-containing protein [Lacunisphaera sp.]